MEHEGPGRQGGLASPGDCSNLGNIKICWLKATSRLAPCSTLDIEGSNDASTRVQVEDLERRGVVGGHVREEAVKGGATRQLCSEDSAARQDEALQKLVVVLIGMVRNIDGTPTYSASNGVKESRRMFGLEHIPIRLYDLPEEYRVVGHACNVRRLGRRIPRIEVVRGTSNRCGLV